MMQVMRRGYSSSLGPHMFFTIDEAKEGFRAARAIQARLERIEGALLVSVNPKTGGVLILYSEQDVTHGQLAAQVRKMGYLRDTLSLVEAGCG
jgi:hypothetical protein